MKPKNKIRKLYYTISEVSELLNLKQQTIRYWETVISELKPQKNRSGNRIYKADDINVIKLVRYLVMGEKLAIHEAEEKIKSYKSQRLYKTMINTVSREEDKAPYMKDETEEQVKNALISKDKEENTEKSEETDMEESVGTEAEAKVKVEAEIDKPQQPLFVFGDDSHDINTANINLVTLGEGEEAEETISHKQEDQEAEISAVAKDQREDKQEDQEAVHTVSKKDMEDESEEKSESIPEIEKKEEIIPEAEKPSEDIEPVEDQASADSVDADSLYRLLEKISGNIIEIRDILNE